VQRPTHEDLDQSSVPLTEGLEGLLASYGAADVTRFIDARFRRPLPKWARVKKGARRFLDEAQAGLLTEGASRAIAPNVELEYVCLAPGDGRAFELNDVDDPDWGGWLLDEFERNLRICVAEKLAKIEPHRSRYPEWWLILELPRFGGQPKARTQPSVTPLVR